MPKLFVCYHYITFYNIWKISLLWSHQGFFWTLPLLPFSHLYSIHSKDDSLFEKCVLLKPICYFEANIFILTYFDTFQQYKFFFVYAIYINTCTFCTAKHEFDYIWFNLIWCQKQFIYTVHSCFNEGVLCINVIRKPSKLC